MSALLMRAVFPHPIQWQEGPWEPGSRRQKQRELGGQFPWDLGCPALPCLWKTGGCSSRKHGRSEQGLVIPGQKGRGLRLPSASLQVTCL